MNRLESNLLDEILFRLNPKSLAMMRCTNKSIDSQISKPGFKSEYLNRAGSSLLHAAKSGSSLACYHAFGDPSTFQGHLESRCRILGSSSGLLLLFVDKCFCVANPVTKKYLFLDSSVHRSTASIGFAVDQIDHNTQSFKVVCVDDFDPGEMGFEIGTDNSWSLSNTSMTWPLSDLVEDMKPVYLDGALHWLRKDGSILAFNPETEQARMITPTNFPNEPGSKLFFGLGDNRLTLISATEETIRVFALESTLTDPEWILARQIVNMAVEQGVTVSWNVHAFDGKCLVVRTTDRVRYGPLLLGYDLRANGWRFLGWIPDFCDANREFCLFTPSWSSVIGMEDEEEDNGWWFPTIHRSKRTGSVETVIELINRNLKI
ncbi:unnamed protein product [Thlaspi arvense]|uniref:F-box associated beta-propeller type 1 domain-containing protein n=1 Tax=Thlaspi arvense TaxID=13288 RepID=A0AAU9R9N5_THLAR|nr:unnamed protein product [Thlaspi arvense]